MSRNDCQEWWNENYPERKLYRSACVGCPFHTKKEWVEVKYLSPEKFLDACVIDEKMRSEEYLRTHKFKNGARPFLHNRGIPLAEAVILDEIDMKLKNSDDVDHFMNECEGHCGL